MDADRFDNLLRSLSETPSRRAALRTLGGLAIGGAVASRLDVAAAKNCGPCRKKKKGKCKKKRPNGTPCGEGRTCQGGRCAAHICEGRDACTEGVAAACSTPGSSCFCFVTAEGTPFCGQGNTVASCEQCEEQFPGNVCFPGTGPQCGAFSCVQPCLV